MNVFILGTGRCGTASFIEATTFIDNYTAGHESRLRNYGPSKLHYPKNHIEADNRLSWFLGRLDKEYGDDAFYVHLTREKDKVAQSFNKRWNHKYGIINGYAKGVLGLKNKNIDIIYDYIDTVESNIQHFLKNKSNKMHIEIEKVKKEFPIFWKKINAKGELEEAIKTFNSPKNKSKFSLFKKVIQIKQNIYK